MECSLVPYRLDFKRPAGTSRGVLRNKQTFFVIIREGDRIGIGEVPIFSGLSYDDTPDFQTKLQEVVVHFNEHGATPNLLKWPSIRFGFETCLKSLVNGPGIYFSDSNFLAGEGIETNALVWMGDHRQMKQRIEEKLTLQPLCIKVKVGAIKHEDELELLSYIREKDASIEIRLDANGAYNEDTVWRYLEEFDQYNIHSIEQPVHQSNEGLLREVCEKSPIPVALDESLISVHRRETKEALLQKLNPAYVVLKPGLLGGFVASDEWIDLAEKHGIGWWATSSLESNVGLAAIAQWVGTKNTEMPQGLGTGQMFVNNISSPLKMDANRLVHDPGRSWDWSIIL